MDSGAVMAAFDPSTAKPFDPGSAQPAFDPSTAKPLDPSSAQPAKPQLGLADLAALGLTGTDLQGLGQQAAGLAKGALTGLTRVADTGENVFTGEGIANALTQRLTGKPQQSTAERARAELNSAGQKLGLGNLTYEQLNELPVAQRPMAEVASVGAQGAAMGGLNPGAALPTALSALGGGTATAIAPDSKTARAAAEILAPMAPGAAELATNMLLNNFSDKAARLAKLARDKYGVQLDTSQLLKERSPLKWIFDVSGKLLGSGGVTRDEDLNTAMTKAVAGTFGSDAEELTPATMTAAKQALGQRFEQFAQDHDILPHAGSDLESSINNILGEAKIALTPQEYSVVESNANNVLDKLNRQGGMGGEVYQSLIRKGGPLDIATNKSAANIREYAQQIESALHDAMGASLTPEEHADWLNTRLRYKNLMTVKDLAARAGIEGTVSPAQIRGAVLQHFKDYGMTGAGDFGELAQIGQAVKPLRSSTTVERGAALAAIMNPLTVLPATGAALANRAVNSPAVTNYLINQVLARGMPQSAQVGLEGAFPALLGPLGALAGQAGTAAPASTK